MGERTVVSFVGGPLDGREQSFNGHPTPQFSWYVVLEGNKAHEKLGFSVTEYRYKIQRLPSGDNGSCIALLDAATVKEGF